MRRGERGALGRLGRRRGGLALGGLLAVSAVALAGCGIPTQSTARPIAKVPYNLLSRQPQSATTTTSPSYTTSITVYFTVTSFKYVAPVTRQVAKATLTTVLQVLLDGPSVAQLSSGYQSAFTRTVRLIRASVSGGVATVDFNRTFGQLSGVFQSLAVAQVVFTVTKNFTNITSLKFQIDNGTTPVPTPSGALLPGPVGSDLYQTLLSPQGSTATTTTTSPTTTTTSPPGGTTAAPPG